MSEGLRRWRALPGDGGWKVVDQVGFPDLEGPILHGEHKPAQDRADVLNRREQYAVIGAKPPEDQ